MSQNDKFNYSSNDWLVLLKAFFLVVEPRQLKIIKLTGDHSTGKGPTRTNRSINMSLALSSSFTLSYSA